MSDVEERVRHLFGLSIETRIAFADTMTETISKAGLRLVNCLLNDGKILVCGYGASAASCQHFSAAMLHSFEVERPPLPVISLATDQSLMTAMAQNAAFDQIFSRQIQALGQKGDVLLILSTSGNSDGILHAVNTAHDREMDCIVLSGRDGGLLATHLGPEDIELRVPCEVLSHIRETHLFILNCFCDLIDQSLFGSLLG